MRIVTKIRTDIPELIRVKVYDENFERKIAELSPGCSIEIDDSVTKLRLTKPKPNSKAPVHNLKFYRAFIGNQLGWIFQEALDL